MTFSLKTKILTAFLCVGLVPLSIVGSHSYLKSSESLEDTSLAKLESIRSLKTKAIDRYFKLKANVIKFKKPSRQSNAPAAKQAKSASKIESQIPNNNDPRFEDV